MDTSTIRALNKINKQFYKTVFTDFDDSRNYFWAGWSKLMPMINAINKPVIRVLDIGCGNGRFCEFLIVNSVKPDYTGLDSSSELLVFAKRRFKPLIAKINSLNFLNFDIVEDPDISALKGEKFDLVVSFGVFHHIPNFELRLQVMNTLRNLLSDSGIMAISFWQFTKSENLLRRAVPKSKLSDFISDPSQLETGDYLLDWKRGESAVRYCHEVDDVEMKLLASRSGLSIASQYYADGKDNDLNLYGVFKSN